MAGGHMCLPACSPGPRCCVRTPTWRPGRQQRWEEVVRGERRGCTTPNTRGHAGGGLVEDEVGWSELDWIGLGWVGLTALVARSAVQVQAHSPFPRTSERTM